ncbi:transposase [Flavobacterium dauae]|nr:transposase [Flavobacterium dauae]WLD25166.1 transposase [Flavobacterium dauae]
MYDRGYPSYNFTHQHIEKNINFLMRVKTTFSQRAIDFVESKKALQTVSFFPGKNTKLSDKPYSKNTPIKVRLVRVELPNNKVEILITSLLDSQEYPSSLFKKMYAERWKIETFYDELKNKLKIEHFSGYSNQTIQQDFYAALFVSNVQTLIANELKDEINEKSTKKYAYKVNSNLSYGFLKIELLNFF